MRFQVLNWSMVLPHLLDLFVAYVLALPIGWSQEREGSSAGLRTFPLVAIASCGLILLGKEILGDNVEAQARILQGLITGIGFIGGGAILRSEQSVHGTATAASVWNVGVIGAAAGFGLYDIAVVLSLVNFATLRLLHPLKKWVNRAGKAED
ncbi:MAG: MgtC/SapB family protein [Rhizobiales bacterium]|nr:MgtC/SapB family protein [Hyphomicrobiales bacterium]